MLIPPVFAIGTHPALFYHELEGNVLDGSAADPPYDWEDIFSAANATAVPTSSALPAGAISSDFTRDFVTSGTTYVNGDDSYFATGSKDTLNITPGWQCKKTNNATDKGDYVNGYGYAANVNVGGVNHIMFFFGLEKDDDNGTNNIGVWLLQDGTVGCVAGNGNTAFTGNHMNNDLLAVVSYNSGGTIGTAQGFTWTGGAGGSLSGQPTFTSNDANCTSNGITPTSKFCITTNAAGAINTPWWSPQKGNKLPTADLQKNVFAEGFIDVTNVFGAGSEPCFASALADTRSSTSPTATLYDFLQISAPTCGPMVIKKYYDKNADGDRDTGEQLLPTWRFKVFADGADPATATPVYDVTTGADGSVTIPSVPFGSYDVYEVLKSGYYNTDPGTGAALKKDITKTAGTQEVIFGNACFVDKSFTITGVPSGAQLALTYAINNGTSTTVNMAADGTSRTYTLADTLKPSDLLDWSWGYQAGGPTGTIVGADDEVLTDYTDTAGDGTSCAKANSDTFPLATLNGTKYKDANDNGAVDAGENGIAGFDFKLRTGSASGTVVGTATSSATGTYSFSNVAPGTYFVTEDSKTGWVQTLPASDGARTVNVPLADNNSVSIGDFANTPLTNLAITVHPQTNFSFGDIHCEKGGTTVGTDVTGTAGVDSNYSTNNLRVGTYTCTVVITDP